MVHSLLLLGYKHVQHVTVLNTVGNCNTVLSIIILYYNIMGPPSYMLSIFDRTVVMRRIPVFCFTVLCSQNVFDVHAQMLRQVSDTQFFVPICLYRSSQYNNSRALMDCTDCVTI